MDTVMMEIDNGVCYTERERERERVGLGHVQQRGDAEKNFLAGFERSKTSGNVFISQAQRDLTVSALTTYIGCPM